MSAASAVRTLDKTGSRSFANFAIRKPREVCAAVAAGAVVAAALAGFCIFLLLPGCDSSQYVVVNVLGLPETGTLSVSTYYSLDSQPGSGGASGVTAPLSQFGIQIPGDTRGSMTVTVAGYMQTGGCYSYLGMNSTVLNGSFRTDLTVPVTPMAVAVCGFGGLPVALPQIDKAAMVTWGDAPDNIWVAGENGTIGSRNSRPSSVAVL